MPAYRYTHVVWDFNGTLLDDLDVAVAAVSDMLTSRGREPMTRSLYYELMEMPIIRYYDKLFDLSEISFETLSQEFVEGYARHFSLARLADGAREAVERFAKAGCRQVVLSSFEQGRLSEILRLFDLEGAFDAVMGADNIRSEGKVDRARDWLGGVAARPERVLVIGDLVHDWEVAQALGADCVLLSCGHQAYKDLVHCGVPVLSNLRELWRVIE